MIDIQPNEYRSNVDDHVIRLGTSSGDPKDNGRKKKNEWQKFNNMKNKIMNDQETLFIVIHDECHYGNSGRSEFHSFFNKPNFDKEHKNVITLLVSATPYSLLTKKSRIENTNIIDWFQENETEEEYHGIKSYIDSHASFCNIVEPGAMVVDKHFESMVGPKSKAWKQLDEELDLEFRDMRWRTQADFKAAKDKSIDYIIRLEGILYQYMLSLIHI